MPRGFLSYKIFLLQAENFKRRNTGVRNFAKQEISMGQKAAKQPLSHQRNISIPHFPSPIFESCNHLERKHRWIEDLLLVMGVGCTYAPCSIPSKCRITRQKIFGSKNQIPPPVKNLHRLNLFDIGGCTDQ